MKLSASQERFAREYLVDLNATKAAIRAGYSKNGAAQQGWELLRNEKVAEYLTTLAAERNKKVEVNAEWLLRRLVDEAEADIADLYDADGNIKPIDDWPTPWRKGLVQGIDIEVTSEPGDQPVVRIVKIRLDNRIRRLELIGKHINVGAFQERIKHEGLEGLGDRLARAAERLKESGA